MFTCYKMLDLCAICLIYYENLRNTLHINENNADVLEKLKSCVPEIEWPLDSKFCLKCLDRLNAAYDFRNLCLNSYQLRITDLKVSCDLKNDLKSKVTDLVQSFTCYDCNEEFKEKNLLIEHTSIHLKTEKNFICLWCSNAYSTERGLKRHAHFCKQEVKEDNNVDNDMNLPSETDDFPKENSSSSKEKSSTPQVEKPTTDVDHNNKHMKRRKKGRPKIENVIHNCETCSVIFASRTLLKRHVRNVHATEKKYKCDMCDMAFVSPSYLSGHKRYHIADRKHICSFCGKGYITASDLHQHEKIHTNKRAYRCDKCSKAFNTSSDLHKHKICVHLDRALWKYECSYCQRKFPSKTNLDSHTKTHTGEKNYACHLCDRRCVSRYVLSRHVESHSNVKSFKCSHCHQGYKYKYSLDLHLARAHGIGNTKIPERVKKYFCHICPKAYYANNKLQKHIRTHTGDRPFHCPKCEKTFTDKSYVKQHLKTSHGVVDFDN